MAVVFQNFETHPDRLEAAHAVCRAHGLTMTDAPTDADRSEIRWIINKTRPIEPAFVGQFPALRGIAVLGTEAWMIDLAEPRPAVITLGEDRGYEVAEHAVALLLAALRKLPQAGSWRRPFTRRGLMSFLYAPEADEVRGGHNWTGMVTGTLYGAKIGILGYGQIGREIHKRLAGFNAEILYHGRCRYPAAIERRIGARFASLEQMASCCTAIFVQLPLTSATRGLVSSALLERANSNLILVNCGRAAVIDEDALYSVLRQRKIAFYAADVFWREPMPLFDRFRRLENCLITPHMAESLPERKHNLLDQALAGILEKERNA